MMMSTGTLGDSNTPKVSLMMRLACVILPARAMLPKLPSRMASVDWVFSCSTAASRSFSSFWARSRASFFSTWNNKSSTSAFCRFQSLMVCTRASFSSSDHRVSSSRMAFRSLTACSYLDLNSASAASLANCFLLLQLVVPPSVTKTTRSTIIMLVILLFIAVCFYF